MMVSSKFSKLFRKLSPSSLSWYLVPSTLSKTSYLTEPWNSNHCNQLYNKRTLTSACTLSSVFSTSYSKHRRRMLGSTQERRAHWGSLHHTTQTAHDLQPFRQYAQLHGMQNLLCKERICHGQESKSVRCDTRRNMSVMSSVVDAAPMGVQPYLRLMRVDKPIGTWLCYWPCAWGIALAADPGHFPSLYMLGLCGVGALVVRGAGCTINDMWDKDFDKSVERTRSRPIASGDISRRQALVFLAAELSVALGILLTLNTYSIVLGCVAMVPIIIYPLMKRFTYWPQVFLGLTFNFGALIGYAAIHGSCDWSIVLPLYASCIAWTIVYDTIYGHQDKRDDLTLGLRSTSILMGEDTKYWLTGFGAAMVSGLILAGTMAEQTVPYYLAVALIAGHIGNQVWTVDIHNPEDCWNKFRSNHRLGVIIFAGIVAGTLAKVSSRTTETDRNIEKRAVDS